MGTRAGFRANPGTARGSNPLMPNRPSTDAPVPPEGGDSGMSLQQVADALGVSRQRAHALEKRALGKLRAALERKGLTFCDLNPDVKDRS